VTPDEVARASGESPLGERLGIGRTAEVYAWRDAEIVKVLRPGFPEELGEREASISDIVNSLDLTAPQFLGVEHVYGRFGLVYERVRGPSMLDRLTARPWLVDHYARQFAALHAGIHAHRGIGLPAAVDSMRWQIAQGAGLLGKARVDHALVRLNHLAPGDAVCHGDMHPGNVIITTAGATVIDWPTATAGPPEHDIARTMFLLTEGIVPGTFPRVQRVLIRWVRARFANIYLRTYRRLRPVDVRDVQQWHLPVVAARVSDGIEDERVRLLGLIDADIARGPRT
jgi:aminoglycoside phosphotransferase (APT) family kinase protein